MTLTVLIFLFCILEVLTPLMVQGVKATLDGLHRTYNATLIALIVSVISAIAMSLFYMTSKGLTVSILNILYILALIIVNWLGSTLGYDKVKEMLTNIKSEE